MNHLKFLLKPKIKNQFNSFLVTAIIRNVFRIIIQN